MMMIMQPVHYCLAAIWVVSTLRLFIVVALQYGPSDEFAGWNQQDTETTPTQPSTSPSPTPLTLPTPGIAYAFMNYIDFMLASIANSSWPPEFSYTSCSATDQCLPSEDCYKSLGCSRGICANLLAPEFQQVIDASTMAPLSSTEIIDDNVSPTEKTTRFIRSTKERSRTIKRSSNRAVIIKATTTARRQRFKTASTVYYYARKAKRLPTSSNNQNRLNYYGMRCSTGEDCSNVGRSNDGVPCIRNGTDDNNNNYFCLCPPQSFFYKESYCKLYEYGDGCTTDVQCNTLFLMHKRMVCRAGVCECADGYGPVTVSTMRASWGIDTLPDWLDSSATLAPSSSRQTYCLSTKVGAYFDDIDVGQNCTVDILGAASPRICADGLTCLFCAGDVNEGTCVGFPILLPTTTTTPSRGSPSPIFISRLNGALLPLLMPNALLSLAIIVPVFEFSFFY